MSTITDLPAGPLPAAVDLQAWDDMVCLREDAYELVEGVPTMPPSEDLIDRDGVALLQDAFNRHRVRGGWLAVSDMDVAVWEVPRPTVRKPDLLIRAAASRVGTRRLPASQVRLVVEFVSPSSVEADHVTKRREYGRAGIPSCLVVDLRSEPGRLWLYRARDERGEFVDVEPADRVTVDVEGVRVDVSVADLRP